MALDGIVLSNLVYELSEKLTDGRINKIYQPEPDAIVLTIKNNRTNYRLLISASASLPLMYLTDRQQANPMTAPNFCMLLRKHISGGRILGITQPGLERIACFEIEHLNELGDLCRKKLIVELMGKYSNIIFCDEDLTILGAVKLISANVSSVREVLPGRTYFIPDTQHKLDPFKLTKEDFTGNVLSQPQKVMKAIYGSITGFSPIAAEELCFRAGVDSSESTAALTQAEKDKLYDTFAALISDIRGHNYSPNIIYKGDEPVEYASFPLTCYGDGRSVPFDSITELLQKYYAEKNAVTRMRQRSYDLRHITGNALDRCRRKYGLQKKQLKDTEKRDKYRIWGEMINTYGYEVEPGASKLDCVNFYTNEPISVPLDPQLTPHENSVKYFNRYTKLKRTNEAVTVQLAETQDEIELLESIAAAIGLAESEEDLSQIREELSEYGYIKKHSGHKGKGRTAKSKPLHYLSSDGFDIYVGKNNFQNEEVTFKIADGGDWWFHAKGVTGSHVIVKTGGRELPDSTYEDAARLAAYYSSSRGADKVEVDYIQRKEVRKSPGKKAGFVIYHTNYSMVIEPDITGLRQV